MLWLLLLLLRRLPVEEMGRSDLEHPRPIVFPRLMWDHVHDVAVDSATAHPSHLLADLILCDVARLHLDDLRMQRHSLRRCN